MPSSAGTGHVFVARTDITRLACDAWLLPTGESMFVAKGWWTNAPSHIRDALDANGHLQLEPPDGWGMFGNRVQRFDRWTGGRTGPQPWLVHMGGVSSLPLQWYLDGVDAYLEAVAKDVEGRPPLHGRAAHLVALPLVGTGFGGAKDIAGDVVSGLLELLWDRAAYLGLDIVLVTWTAQAFAAAQSQRRSRGPQVWPALSEGLLLAADQLASRARAGELVLFLGAGVSVGAGLPTWEGLLRELSVDADLSTADGMALAELDALDQARILAGRLMVNGVDLGQKIARRFDVREHSLCHSLLAGLPVQEIATMNYDELFEQAAEGAGEPVRMLPYGGRSDTRRWLLKMHGTVSVPSDIVLTREDYLRYAERRQALAGIVQALLITRHMLFVGFSLTDDNFHRIADDVRKSLAGRPERETEPFGSALLLQDAPLMTELWDGDIEFVTVGDSGRPMIDGARQLEIFLDYLLAQSIDAGDHLLDDDFVSVLTSAEQQLRDALLEFLARVPSDARDTAAWVQVRRALQTLGLS